MGEKKTKPKNKSNNKPKSKEPLSDVYSKLKNEKFIDTHVHLEYILQKKKIQLSTLEEQLESKWFDGCICIFCDPLGISDLGMSEEILKNEKVFGAFGFHPHHAKYYNEDTEKRLLKLLNHPKCIAYGECGLDYHYNHSPQEDQKKVFVQQLKLGVSTKKPIIIHTREAEKDTFDILKSNCPQDYKIHVHCFTDSAEFAESLLKEFPNLYFGFTGVLTYSKSTSLQSVVKDVIPLNRILLETDGPYMVKNNTINKGTKQ
jgi:TatD DNase family protein